MIKFLLSVVLFICTAHNAIAQRPNAGEGYEYFVDIKGVKGKPDIAYLESTIQKKAEVTFFQAKSIKAQYFILRISRPITQSELQGWISNNAYQVIEITADPGMKEKLVKRKNIHS
jgi:hypothetical protein